MDITRLCFDTSALIAFLKNRRPGADAVEMAVPLLTLNERHFTRIPGLIVLTPSEILVP